MIVNNKNGFLLPTKSDRIGIITEPMIPPIIKEPPTKPACSEDTY